ncbi:ubiquitin [Crassaminicella thermophila]|uniref:Ubiquitin n=1 Tax=Crassaminicella thermophila TaxID=2599308 RepID=A0A5C0SDI7_CRATE|nr:ubiquitin [Crassaminicella thermophila]QEK12615.1 ubiquitin [Crassaminicella thermophila]
MIKTKDMNFEIFTGTMLYITIDTFRFIFDEDTFYLTVEIENNGEFEFLEEVELDEAIVNHNDLKRVALNWVFKNVEIVKELESEQA